MSEERAFATEEERWEALRGEGVEAGAPEGFAPDGGEEFEEVGV